LTIHSIRGPRQMIYLILMNL